MDGTTFHFRNGGFDSEFWSVAIPLLVEVKYDITIQKDREIDIINLSGGALIGVVGNTLASHLCSRGFESQP